MAKCYQKLDSGEMKPILASVNKYHPDLKKCGVTIDCLWVFDGSGHSCLKHHGYGACAVVRKVPLKERAKGHADAEIVFDQIWWESASASERDAVIDHELTHLIVKKDDKGNVVTDDCNRPKLNLQLHDIQFGGFTSIVRKHGQHAPEAQAAKAVQEQWGQLLMWGMEPAAVG